MGILQNISVSKDLADAGIPLVKVVGKITLQNLAPSQSFTALSYNGSDLNPYDFRGAIIRSAVVYDPAFKHDSSVVPQKLIATTVDVGAVGSIGLFTNDEMACALQPVVRSAGHVSASVPFVIAQDGEVSFDFVGSTTPLVGASLKKTPATIRTNDLSDIKLSWTGSDGVSYDSNAVMTVEGGYEIWCELIIELPIGEKIVNQNTLEKLRQTGILPLVRRTVFFDIPVSGAPVAILAPVANAGDEGVAIPKGCILRKVELEPFNSDSNLTVSTGTGLDTLGIGSSNGSVVYARIEPAKGSTAISGTGAKGAWVGAGYSVVNSTTLAPNNLGATTDLGDLRLIGLTTASAYASSARFHSGSSTLTRRFKATLWFEDPYPQER